MGFWDTIKRGLGNVGKAIHGGWTKLKQVGNTAYDSTIGKIPFVGKALKGVLEASPLGMASHAIDAGVNIGSNLLQGDLDGAKNSLVNGVKGYVNQKNSLVEELKKNKHIGGFISKFQDGVESSLGVDELRDQANQLLGE